VLIRPAKIENLPIFLRAFRVEDVEEMKALHGADFSAGLRAAIGGAFGYECFEAWTEKGRPHAIFGISEPVEGAAQIFMVGSEALVVDRREFMRLSKKIIGSWLPYTQSLYCWVDVRNLTHVRYLRHLGFHVEQIEPVFGALGLTFHKMVRMSSVTFAKEASHV
jgi:hypothetical protein